MLHREAKKNLPRWPHCFPTQSVSIRLQLCCLTTQRSRTAVHDSWRLSITWVSHSGLKAAESPRKTGIIFDLFICLPFFLLICLLSVYFSRGTARLQRESLNFLRYYTHGNWDAARKKWTSWALLGVWENSVSSVGCCVLSIPQWFVDRDRAWAGRVARTVPNGWQTLADLGGSQWMLENPEPEPLVLKELLGPGHMLTKCKPLVGTHSTLTYFFPVHWAQTHWVFMQHCSPNVSAVWLGLLFSPHQHASHFLWLHDGLLNTGQTRSLDSDVNPAFPKKPGTARVACQVWLSVNEIGARLKERSIWANFAKCVQFTELLKNKRLQFPFYQGVSCEKNQIPHVSVPEVLWAWIMV